MLRLIKTLVFAIYIGVAVLTACTTHEIKFVQWDDGLPKDGEWRTPLAIGDVNNDGLLDIAGIARKGDGNMSVWLNLGNGSWKRSVQGIPQQMECGVGVDFGDVNNDGNLDVVFGRHCGGANVYLGDGKGSWRGYSKGLLKENVNPAKLADFDSDGKPELVTLGAFFEGFHLYKRTPEKWVLINETGLPDKIHATTYCLLTPDLNNDGLPDILATGGRVQAFTNTGNLTFKAYSEGLPEQGFWTYLATGDVNNDKFLEIAASGPGLYIYAQSNGTWQVYKNFTKDCPRGGGVALADINSDNTTDLLASCENGFKLFLNKNNQFKLARTNLPFINSTQHGLQVADVNNDGKQDLIAAFGSEGNPGGVFVWKATE